MTKTFLRFLHFKKKLVSKNFNVKKCGPRKKRSIFTDFDFYNLCVFCKIAEKTLSRD